MNNQSFLF